MHSEFNDYIKYYNLYPELRKIVIEYTDELWNKKGMDGKAESFNSLLDAIDLIGFTFYYKKDSKPYAIRKCIAKEKFPEPADRDILRKAYYCLANYYFGEDFKKSIFYYKVAIILGQKSPFLDYLQLQHPGGGIGISSYCYKDVAINEYGNVPKFLWEYNIPVPDLITPSILFNEHLENWASEPSNMAPCYFIAYNLACAYSRMNDAETAMDWLRVAISLNRELRTLASKDQDLLYVRNSLKDEFADLLRRSN